MQIFVIFISLLFISPLAAETILEGNFTQGGLVSTDNSLDLAIDGSGFFQALLPDGRVGYTRAGVLSRNAEGLLTTSSGYVVQPQITIPNDATGINISNSGIVSVTVPGNDFGQEVGQISLVNFSNPRGLTPIGENFLVESSESGQPQAGAPLSWPFARRRSHPAQPRSLSRGRAAVSARASACASARAVARVWQA